MHADMDRRAFLTATAALTAGAWLPRWSAAQGGKTRLILLGTGGGPRPKTVNMSSAQVIIVKDALYVVDCGDGVARQLVVAGASLQSLRHVFITHHHSDHNADYGNLLLLSWASGVRTRVDTWGPPPVEKITRLFLEMSAYDIDTRRADEGRVPLAPLIHVHELTQPGIVMRDENVTVTSALVDHPPVTPALAYRFDTADRSIVISGDTARSDNPVKLARGGRRRSGWPARSRRHVAPEAGAPFDVRSLAAEMSARAISTLAGASTRFCGTHGNGRGNFTTVCARAGAWADSAAVRAGGAGAEDRVPATRARSPRSSRSPVRGDARRRDAFWSPSARRAGLTRSVRKARSTVMICEATRTRSRTPRTAAAP